jgi:hypothetical protein
MKLRTLRIALSIACGIACALLIMLWARSYKWRDHCSIGELANRGWAVESALGQLAFRVYPVNHNAPALTASQTAASDDPSWPANNRFGFDAYFGRDYAGIVVPHWLLVALTAIAAALLGVNRPIRFRFGPPKGYARYLRIAFSAACGIVCMLLIVLWARSYVYSDSLAGPVSGTKSLMVASLAGAVQFRLDDRKWSNAGSFHWRKTTESVTDLNEALEAFHRLRAKLGSTQAFTRINNSTRIGWDGDTLFLPCWLLVLVTGTLAAAVGMQRPYRFCFTLRTLLVATTLIAITLGLIVYFSR